jgi:hypothetical protein
MPRKLVLAPGFPDFIGDSHQGAGKEWETDNRYRESCSESGGTEKKDKLQFSINCLEREVAV